ncbi:respiratory nitrate reductase subunit gamma [Nocardia sp. NPDC101769]|uniref:respiratory nitrate reductase subunit gamma n=1 Tax=Nocardia sp. NPDC101769 TaxID=3364333 RepID=UPI0038187C04
MTLSAKDYLLWVAVPYAALVHVFSAPVGYLTRPYVVYRSRDVWTPGESQPKRGWEPVGH